MVREIDTSLGNQDVHNEQLQAAWRSGICFNEWLRDRLLSIERRGGRKVSKTLWVDCRVRNNPVYVNERIDKFLENKQKKIEEKIELMKSVYGEIIPKNENSQKPIPYVKM